MTLCDTLPIVTSASKARRINPFWLMVTVILLAVLKYQNTSNEEYSSIRFSRKLEEQHGPTFFLVLGVEGTGHHLFLTLFEEYLKSGNGLSRDFFRKHKIHDKFSFNSKLGPSLWSAPCAKESSNGTALLEEAVETMKWIDSEIKSEGLEHVAVVPINAGFHHTMNSYPTRRGDCRPLQYPDVDLTYAACEKAGVQCKHIVLSRDPYEIIRSTVDSRSFDLKHRQIKLMTTMLDVMNTQMLSYPDKLHSCWSYDKGAESILNIGKSFGWGADNFTNIYSDLFVKHGILADEEHANIISPELQPFMDTMVRAMARVEATCESILKVSRLGKREKICS